MTFLGVPHAILQNLSVTGRTLGVTTMSSLHPATIPVTLLTRRALRHQCAHRACPLWTALHEALYASGTRLLSLVRTTSPALRRQRARRARLHRTAHQKALHANGIRLLPLVQIARKARIRRKDYPDGRGS